MWRLRGKRTENIVTPDWGDLIIYLGFILFTTNNALHILSCIVQNVKKIKEKKKRWPPPAILTDNIPPLDLDLDFPSGSCLMLLGYWPTWTLQKDFHFYQTEDGF